MKRDYDGLLYYRDCRADKEECEKAISILESTDFDNLNVEVNKVLELLHVQRLVSSESFEVSYNSATVEKYRKISDSINSFIGRYFSKINDTNFISICDDIYNLYFDEFLTCVEKYKAFEHISESTFSKYLIEEHEKLYQVLAHEKLVLYYDKVIASIMLTSAETAPILANKHLGKDTSNVILPRNLSPDDYEQIFQKYIDSEEPNPKILELIFISQNSKECPLSDKVRLNAKKKHDEFWKKRFDSGNCFSYSVGVVFDDVDKTECIIEKDHTYLVKHDRHWLEEYLDYPTILNNFIYVFGMFDIMNRATFVSAKSKIGVIEDLFTTKGKKSFPKGNDFHVQNMLSLAQTKLYYEFLKERGIELETVFKWFFEEYLKEEFGVEGFTFEIPSKGTTYLEKIRTIAPEMDGAIKQFQMYVSDGRIDRELYEMSSEHVVFSNIGSLIKNKYGYASDSNIFKAMHHLFSDQCILSYTNKTKNKYHTFYNRIISESTRITDYDFGTELIEWLIEENYLLKDEAGYISVNKPNVALLKDLYDHDVACLSYYPKEQEKLDKLNIESTLFSKPEQDYLNYMLNKAEFSDGHDLRNKYIHSTYPKDEETQYKDYLEFLKIMVLIIVKINEEFCLNDAFQR